MINEIEAKSILRKHKRIDSWFLSSYSINLYRGCTHNCVYCDGRTEKYRVEGEFGKDITVKVNAPLLLDRELNPARKRKPFANGFMVICGGVSDSYQPFEGKYNLCRETLQLIKKYNHPVHILTKSTLVERDIELLKEINQTKKAIVSFSFSTADDELGKLLEPGVPAPSERFAVMKKFKSAGITCGMYYMPVIPFITDSEKLITETVSKAGENGVDFINFGGLTLKEGIQKDYFTAFLKDNFPQHLEKYEMLYSPSNQWGAPKWEYAAEVDKVFDKIASEYGIAKRIPVSIYRDLVSKNELVTIMLEQIDYLARLKGKNSPYGYAAHSVSKINEPLENLSQSELLQIKGVGNYTAKLVLEILEKGSCSFYEKMLRN